MVAKAKVDMIEEHGLETLYAGVIALMLKDSRNKGSTRFTTDFLRGLTREQWEELRKYVEKKGVRPYRDLLVHRYPPESDSKDSYSETRPAALC